MKIQVYEEKYELPVELQRTKKIILTQENTVPNEYSVVYRRRQNSLILSKEGTK